MGPDCGVLFAKSTPKWPAYATFTVWRFWPCGIQPIVMLELNGDCQRSFFGVAVNVSFVGGGCSMSWLETGLSRLQGSKVAMALCAPSRKLARKLA